MTNNKLFAQYRALEEQYKILDEERSSLRSKIVEVMLKEKTGKIENDYGVFTVGARSVWSYTDGVKKLEEKVKIAKVKEQQKGIAEEKITNYLVYSNNTDK